MKTNSAIIGALDKAVRHADASTAPPTAPAWPSRRYAWYTAIVLTACYTLSYIDRQILGLLLEPIRHSFTLTDTQVSLLAGTAFALFYVTLGLPLGRLADRASRRNLIFVGVFFWSLMTAACGLAQNFWQLFAARVGVGVGEAALSPAAHSIISDSFPPDKRVRPLALYTLALAAGSGLAYIAGGTISGVVSSMPELRLPLLGPLTGWQVTFITVGAPGMIFAFIILTLREPIRRGIRWSSPAAAASSAPPVARVREVFHFIWRENPRTFAVLFLAYGGFGIHTDSLLVWMPTLFMRRFGWAAPQIGVTLGLVILFSATIGILGSMTLATRLQAKGSPDALLRTSLFVAMSLTPLGIALPFVDSPALMLALLAPIMALSFGLFAVVPPILQLITPNQMRGQVAATFSFFNNVIGLMFGATYVALLTDHLFRDTARLHHSLAVVAATVLPLATLLMWWGLPYFGQSIVKARAWLGNTAR
jgi:MFS family permease